MEVGARGVQGLPLLAQPTPDKVTPSSHEPPLQWSQEPVTLIYQGKNKWGRDGGKRMIQRLNEESGRQENVVLSTLEVMQARLTALYPND